MPTRYFLRTREQYENAPIGTVVGPFSTAKYDWGGRLAEKRMWPEVTYRVTKAANGHWYADNGAGRANVDYLTAREVIRWGDR
jgi:hypothetical protein